MTEQPALDFAGLLRQLRVEARLTQEELAEAAGVSPRTVSDLERRVNRTAHKDTAGLLAEALGLAGTVRGVFVAAARGRASAAEVLAARADAPAALAAAVLGSSPGPASAPVPRELPADVGAFTGRAVELAELDLLLPDAPEGGDATGPVVISALSGTAGVGKTALAVRWAHRVAPQFPDGQLYVNLRGYDPDRPVTAGEALAGFLRALGVASSGIPLEEAERAARYRSLVAGKRLLVVLDNAATVDQVRPLLPGSSTVMVVATSRDSLAGLVARDGARRLDLDLLPATDAVALLGSLIGGRAEADPAAAAALANQCARLPLALRVAAELAVSRPDTPLAELVTELADEGERLDLLDAGGDPHGAVASVFSWSYRHLDPEAARLFRLLGLHPGPDWDRYAAAALADLGLAEAGKLLGGLARVHLIEPVGAARYGLHDLLRAYAAGLAATHDQEEARRVALTGLFDYYLAACAAAMDCLAPAERGQRPIPPPIRVPVPEFGDLLAARTWLDAELTVLVAVSAYTASYGWPGHVIQLAATLFRYLDGDHNIEGLTICRHALNAARDCGDRAAQARPLTWIGVFHDRQGHYHEAVGYHEQAADIARAVGDQSTEAIAVGNIAMAYEQQGLYQLAADHYQLALTLYRRLGDDLGEAINLTNLGDAFLRQGSYQRAVETQQQALACFRELGDQLGQAIALMNLGEACYRQGRYPEATGHGQHALALTREIGDRHDEAEALSRLGDICNRLGDHDQADEYHHKALVLYQETGLGGQADALNGLGETLLATGRPSEAHAYHKAALTLTRQTGNRREHARALTRLAAAFRQQGDLDQAADYDQQALTAYREIGDPGGEAEALNGAGETLLATGRSAEARDRHGDALALARRTGDRYQQARAHRGLAEACRAAGQADEARQHGQQALDIYTDLGVPEATPVHISNPAAVVPAGGVSADSRGGST